MQTFRKYEFYSQEQLIQAKEEMELQGAFCVDLGHITLVPGEYDSEGNQIKAPVISDKFHLDTLYPEDPLVTYKENEIWCQGIGAHSFLGCDNFYIDDRHRA